MPDKSNPPTNLRESRRQAERQLAWWVVFFLVVVGGLVISLIYGWQAALLGVACLMGGAALFSLLWLIVSLIGRWAGDE